MKKTLFEYAVLLHPANDEGDTKMIIEPGTILAKNEEMVRVIAHRKLDPGHVQTLERVEVLIRPFSER